MSKSKIIETLEEEKKILPFILPEVEVTEVEKFIKDNPQVARVFVEKYAKGEINWDQFTPHERGILLHGIVEASVKDPEQIAAIKALKDADWLREPPTPEEFVNDPKYLGKEISKSIYAPWRKDLIYVLDPKNEIHEWICFTGDTKIALLDGTSPTIKELAERNEKEFWVYSCDKDGNIVPGRAHSARKTRSNAKLIKVTLDNREIIRCTPDHKFLLRDGTYEEAQYLKPGTSLMPLYREYEKMEEWGHLQNGYERVFNPFTSEWIPTHRVVAHYTYGLPKTGVIGGDRVIHHSSFNKLNNNPDKLQILSSREHFKLHSEQGNSNWTKPEIRNRLLEHLKSEKMRRASSERFKGRVYSEETLGKMSKARKGKPVPQFDSWRTSEEGLKHALSVSALGLEAARHPDAIKKRLINCQASWDTNVERRQAASSRMAARNNSGLAKEASAKSALKKKEESKKRYEALVLLLAEGKTVKEASELLGINGTSGNRLLAKFGYPTWFVKNHKVTSIEMLEEEEDVFCLTVDDFENFALASGVFVHNCSGGIGVGKTRVAIISQLYKLCVLTCLRNIPSYFGLDNATTISFGLFSLSLEKAESAISEDFKKIIGQSPYFKNVFPLKKSRTIKKILNNTSTNKNSQAEYEVQLPQGLAVLMGSKVSHALSFAVVSAILDEMNFRGKRTVKYDEDEDSSEKLYSQIRFRITSRFERLGYVPGLLCVISSRKTSSDFLESRISQIDGGLSSKTGSWRAKNDPRAYISNYSQWDVKPDKYYGDTEERKHFYVFVGSSKTSSRILTPAELDDYPKDSPNIIEVPESVRPHFERDVNGALRELAGISSSPQHLLFEDPAQLKKLWDKERKSPFIDDNLYIGLKTPRSISSHLIPQNMFFDAGFAMVPKYHPNMLRVLHIDLSKDGDATGIAMGGVSGIKEMVGSNILGQKIISSYSPEFFIDFAISIRAPQGDQVDYEKIQQFINYLRAMKFRIHYITFDRYQSVGSMQMLIKDGFKVDNLSVDTSDIPYVMLRDAVSKGNVKIYHQPELERELVNLIHDYSGARARVDHPRMNPDGTKGRKDACFTGDTRVRLLDGRNLTFLELEKEFGNHTPFYVYTIKNGKISVGKAFNVRKTINNSSLVEVELDNGEKVRCTPEHRFMLRNGEYKEAQYLSSEDSLMPLYTKISDFKKHDMYGYELYYCPQDNKWHYTHRMVGKWKYPGRYTGNQYGEGVIHHKKGKLNNDPCVLEMMTAQEHSNLHSHDLKLRRKDPIIEQRRIANLKKYNDLDTTKAAQSKRIKELHKKDGFKERAVLRGSILGKKTGTINITKYNRSQKHKEVASRIGKITIYKAIEACSRRDITIDCCIDLRQQGKNNLEIAKHFNCSVSLIERRFINARKLGIQVPVSPYRKKNHKVNSVKILEYKEDVYDLSVEETNNFALSSGIFVHNSDALAGVLANSFALLTDTRKHPDTANADIAAKIINSLYPNKINPADAIGNYFANVTTENEEVNKHIEEMNPFSFKIT